MQHATSALLEEIAALAIPVSSNQDLLNIATVSTSGDASMGSIIARAYEKIGDTGSTVLEEHKGLVDDIEFIEGYTIERGYLSPYFVSDTKRSVCELNKPRVLVTDQKLDDVKELVPLLELMVRASRTLGTSERRTPERSPRRQSLVGRSWRARVERVRFDRARARRAKEGRPARPPPRRGDALVVASSSSSRKD